MTDFGSAAAASDLVALLPWRAAGALGPAEALRIDRALARDADLACRYARVRWERAEINALHDDLGVPSPRASIALFAAIDAFSRVKNRSRR